MAIHGNFLEFSEAATSDPFSHHQKKMLKVMLHYGPVKARLGSMVAYQGDVRFEHAGSGGASKWLKSKVTGEGLPVMDVTGNGELFLADAGQDVQILYLDNDMITCNGSSVLAFHSHMEWDIVRTQGAGMMAGGLYNVVLKGTGYVALVTDGPPIVLDVTQAPTFTDPQATVMWTSGVTTDVRTDIGLKTFIGKGSGESFQLAFGGQGHVMVQPAETVLAGSGTTSGGGGGLGNLLGG